MIPPIKWRVLFEVKNLDPGDVFKRDHLIVDTLTSVSNCDLRSDIFDLPYDVYFL